MLFHMKSRDLVCDCYVYVTSRCQFMVINSHDNEEKCNVKGKKCVLEQKNKHQTGKDILGIKIRISIKV